MRPIDNVHVTEPGLAVVEVPAADDETAFAVQELLATRWAIAPKSHRLTRPRMARTARARRTGSVRREAISM
ncbi:DUF6207 family protein [Streptomyces sp. enrichment culture]|uniref:DUF6207 family protein n=1 Tax=Streptomyces sp. enrichment culture TaxID=1795815 RepID=UPI003F55790C